LTTSKNARLLSSLLVLMFLAVAAASAQITPSDDAYVNSATPTANYGAAVTLNLQSAADTGFIRFDLTAVPAGYTGSSVAKATLKLYVNSVTTAGSFNVDLVNGTWTEKKIDYSNEPAIGALIVASVPLAPASKGTYVEIDITPAVVEWLNNTQPNDGIALVANSPLVATFDSKENTAASHPPEIDIVFAGIAGVTTASGSGLTGGGTSGTLNLSLNNTCAAKQVLQWNGTAWGCANLSGGGTITGVTAGADLTGGGTSGSVTLNVDTTKLPQLNYANTFTGNQTVNGNLSATGTVTGSSFGIGSNLFAFGSYANQNAFLGFAGNATISGLYNTGSGVGALFSDTTGYGNIANGAAALYSNTTGYYNTASGYQALGANTTGYLNTASGTGALSSNTTGYFNTASGFGALGSNTAGSQNTASGYEALYSNTTGSSNTALGYKAGPDQNSLNLTDATAIGAYADVTQSNSLVLGSINGVNGASASANVGIGTTAPQYSLDVHGTGNFTGPVKFASGQQFPGTIAGVKTGSGSGLMGGGTSGTLNLSLTNACAANQVLQWNGTAWVCASLSGGGTITGVTAGTDLTGGGTSGNVTLNLDISKVPQLNASNSFNGNQTVSGYVNILAGSGSGFAMQAVNTSTSGQTFGAQVLNSSPAGAGVLGFSSSLSNTGSAHNNTNWSSGIWADSSNTSTSSRQALLATADDASSIEAVNNSPSGYPTIFAVQNGSGNAVLAVSGTGTGVSGSGATYGVYGAGPGAGSNYGVFSYGNLGATGTKTAVVALPDDRVVSLYAMESPENWFEDFGSGQLNGGVATIELDSTFAQTVSPEMGYHVFLTPNGDCEGLYVAQKTATGFEVRELRAGKSSVAFEYRIVAKRKGLESLRMEDVGADHDTAAAIRQQISLRSSHSPKLVLPKPTQHQEAPTPSH
jgi:hypothetical protein